MTEFEFETIEQVGGCVHSAEIWSNDGIEREPKKKTQGKKEIEPEFWEQQNFAASTTIGGFAPIWSAREASAYLFPWNSGHLNQLAYE